MKKTTGILACFIIVVLGCFLLVYNSLDKDSSTPQSVPSNVTPMIELSGSQQKKKDNRSSVTQDEFEQLPQEQQDEMMEEFIIDFWEKELGLSQDTGPQEERLSLDIFNRPYMKTITEDEYWQLSPEEQEKAMAEVVDIARKTRSFVQDVIAQGKYYLVNNDYVRAEAHLIYAWEIGREFTTNKEGMYITRVVGISFEKDALNELVGVYTQLGDHSNVQAAKERLSDLDAEVVEMRNAAKQFEATN